MRLNCPTCGNDDVYTTGDPVMSHVTFCECKSCGQQFNDGLYTHEIQEYNTREMFLEDILEEQNS